VGDRNVIQPIRNHTQLVPEVLFQNRWEEEPMGNWLIRVLPEKWSLKRTLGSKRSRLAGCLLIVQGDYC